MKKLLFILGIGITGYTANAQNAGGIWLSGAGIVSEGTGIHNGETEILSVQDSIVDALSTSGGGAPIGKVVHGNFTFRKILNASSAFFFSFVNRGTFIPSLTFKFYDKKGNTFVPTLTVTLSNVIVSKYRIASPDAQNKNASGAVEEISLFYSQIQYTDASGNSVQFPVTAHF